MTNIWFKLFFIFYLNFAFPTDGYVPPKLVLFSFDAFRSDYLHKELTPTMYQLSKKGVQTQSMKSCFATKTFPNHFSIATGLYEENHGIVNNKMYDPLFDSYFNQSNLENRWWQDMKVDPIWNVNQRFGKGHISASSMWPGSPVAYEGQVAKYVQKFERGQTFIQRMDKAIEWLTLEEEPANFVLIYIDEPDETSHNYGPFSPQVRKVIKDLDDAVAYFLKRLEEFELIKETNIIIVSDHGMSEVREERVIYLTDLCDSKDMTVSGVSPNLNLFLKDKTNLEKVYQQLKNASLELPFSVYKTSEVPANYHFNNHRRLGDIVIEADDKYEVVLKQSSSSYDYDNAQRIIADMKSKIESIQSKAPYTDKMDIIQKFNNFLKKSNQTDETGKKVKYWGEHGYNNSLVSMRPLFLASGPALQKQYIHRTPFMNIDLYSLFCSILHLNLDPNLKPTDQYCMMDGKPSRIKKMLVPIKFTGDVPHSSEEDPSMNIFFILLLGASFLVCLGGAFTLCTAAASNSIFNKNRKQKLYNIDLDEDVIDIDLSQYQRTRPKVNTSYRTTLNEEEQVLINANESLDYV